MDDAISALGAPEQRLGSHLDIDVVVGWSSGLLQRGRAILR